jgi:hypothetical protein
LIKPNFEAGQRARLRKVPWPKSRKTRASVSQQELPRSPQILRQRWIIIGEFLVSFTLTHISAIRLRD